MQKFQCLLFVLKRSYICYYVICMTVPLSPFKSLRKFIIYLEKDSKSLKCIIVSQNLHVFIHSNSNSNFEAQRAMSIFQNNQM